MLIKPNFSLLGSHIISSLGIGKPIFPKMLVKSLLIPILFITFALVILRIVGDESLA